MPVRAQLDLDFSNPVAVLNYALTLEHLEFAFYRDGLTTFSVDDFVTAGYAPLVYEYFGRIRDDEELHVKTLVGAIESMNATPVAEATYNFGYADVTGFVAVAQALEGVGVGAYQGAAGFLITQPKLLTAALTIHGVEARHASYLNGLTAVSPFPDAFNPAMTPEAVLQTAAPFIVS
jgi:hypothetical protein